MNLADFLRQGPLAQQRMADASAFDRDSELANMMRQHGTVQDPNMVQEPSVLGNLPIDVPQPTQQDMQMGAEQVMNMMPMAGITAFHGSPHKFTKFDMSKIGTGEGAQAYGHGIYAAENPKVAKEYLNPDANYKRAYGHLNNRQEFIKDMMDQGREKEEVWQMTKDKYSEFIEPRELDLDFQSIWSDGPGNLYKVDIPDDQIAKMLDWDKPLSEQPESVRKALEANNILGDFLHKNDYGEVHKGVDYFGRVKDRLGSLHFKKLRDEMSLNELRGGLDEATSKYLNNLGIKGIKYLDGGSRSGGKGTSNFVLFADDIAKILERNDQPIGELAEMLSSGKKVKP